MKDMNRRKFFKLGAVGFLSIPFMKAFAMADEARLKACGAAVELTEWMKKKKKNAITKDTPKYEDYEYVAVATESKSKKYKKGQDCRTCIWFKNKEKDVKKGRMSGEWAACAQFGNHLAPSCAWCNKYKADNKKLEKFKV